VVVLAMLTGGWACYQGGETLDLDLDDLEQVELRSDGLQLIGWLARTPAEHTKGLAVVEADRLRRRDDGRLPAMLYELAVADVAMPPFRLRLQPMDIAVLSRDGRVLALGTLPTAPEIVPGAAYVLEALGGTFETSGVRLGTRFHGLEASGRRRSGSSP